MNRILALAAIAALALLLAACKTTSDALRVVEVHQPMTVRPAAPTPLIAGPQNGAIFQPLHVAYANYQPLFEDRRARNVGDLLTIQINEKVAASKSATTAADRKGAMSFVVPDVQVGKWGRRPAAASRRTARTNSRAVAIPPPTTCSPARSPRR